MHLPMKALRVSQPVPIFTKFSKKFMGEALISTYARSNFAFTAYFS
jgi:hypothetical protein